MIWKTLLFGAFAILVIIVAVPEINRLATGLFAPSEDLTITRRSSAREESSMTGAADMSAPQRSEMSLRMVTILGFDAIPAILDPSFVTADEAEVWMRPDEQVLALSINGDHRAYSINMLSRHEIVNDVVGGVPVAVTW